MTDEPIVSSDFNERDPSGNVLILREDLPGGASEGDDVILGDDEGNRVRGTVVQISHHLAAVAPAWDTWSPSATEDVQRERRIDVRLKGSVIELRMLGPYDVAEDLVMALGGRVRAGSSSASVDADVQLTK